MSNRITIGKTGIKAYQIGLGAGVVGNTMMYPKGTEEMGRQHPTSIWQTAEYR